MNKKGFTLLELLVVVLIIGILASVALPQYRKAVLKSRLGSMFPTIRAFHNAEEAHYLATGNYTVEVEELGIDFSGATESSDGTSTYLDYGNDIYRIIVEPTLVSGSIMKDGQYVIMYQIHHQQLSRADRCVGFDKISNAVCASLGGEKQAWSCTTGDTHQSCTFYEM